MTDDQKAVLTLFSRRVSVGKASEAEIEFMEWYARQNVDIENEAAAETACEQANNWVN